MEDSQHFDISHNEIMLAFVESVSNWSNIKILCCIKIGKANMWLALGISVFINNHFAMCFVFIISMTHTSSE